MMPVCLAHGHHLQVENFPSLSSLQPSLPDHHQIESAHMVIIKNVGLIVVGIAGFALVFLLLYGIVNALPRKIRERAQAVPFILFALLFAVGGLFVSAIGTVIASFKDDVNGKTWVGLDNYKWIWDWGNSSSVDSRLAVLNSFLWVFLGTLVTVSLGLLLARFADGMKGESVAKTLVFLPVAISLVGAGLTWKFIYAERGFSFSAGLLNEVTKGARVPKFIAGGEEGRNWILERGYLTGTRGVPGAFQGFEPPPWVPGFNTLLLIVIFVWAQTGIATVVLSAAIKGVPQELIEAATVDGATRGEVFRRVTIPYIKGTIATVTSLVALASLKAFDIVAGSSGGRFGTTTLANEFYNKKFTEIRDGAGAALAVALFVLCFPIVVWNRRVQRRVEETN
jgi:alpha-glucoside transport system permease protein